MKKLNRILLLEFLSSEAFGVTSLFVQSLLLLIAWFDASVVAMLLTTLIGLARGVED